jgi:hypothetical protein
MSCLTVSWEQVTLELRIFGFLSGGEYSLLQYGNLPLSVSIPSSSWAVQIDLSLSCWYCTDFLNNYLRRDTNSFSGDSQAYTMQENAQ